jgi:hypothetical protein
LASSSRRAHGQRNLRRVVASGDGGAHLCRSGCEHRQAVLLAEIQEVRHIALGIFRPDVERIGRFRGSFQVECKRIDSRLNHLPLAAFLLGEFGQRSFQRGHSRGIAVNIETQRCIVEVGVEPAGEELDHSRVAHAERRQDEGQVAGVVLAKLAGQFEQRLQRGGAQAHDTLHNLVRNVGRIAAYPLDQVRQNFGRRQIAEDVFHHLFQIERILFVVLSGEAQHVGDGAFALIHNRVQKAMVDGDVAVSRRLQQLVNRNLSQMLRIEDEFGANYSSSLTTCTVTSVVTSRCSRSGTLNSPKVLIGSSSAILRRSMV